MSISSFTSKRTARGAAMVEMAILVSLLVLLFVGITEIGRALFYQHKLTKAAEAGARYLGRAYGAVDPSSCATATGWATGVAGAANIAATGRADGTGTAVVPGLVAGTHVTGSVVTRSVTADDVAKNICVVKLAIAVPYSGIFFGGDGGFLPPVILGGDGVTGWILTAASEERYVGD